MSGLKTITTSLDTHIYKQVIEPISKHYGVDSTEVCEYLGVTKPRTVSRTATVNGPRCIYTPERSKNPGVPCGKPAAEGEDYCKTCLKKPRVIALLEGKKTTKPPLLAKMPSSLLAGPKLNPIKSLAGDKQNGYVSKPIKFVEQEEEDEEEADETVIESPPVQKPLPTLKFGKITAGMPPLGVKFTNNK